MADAVCPRGHLSDDPDFCSECGLRIAAVPAAGAGQSAAFAASGAASAALSSTLSPAPPAPAAGCQPCPDCGTPRVPGARFCEMCRHDFSGGTAASSPASKPPAAPMTPPAAAPAPVAPPPAPPRPAAAAPPVPAPAPVSLPAPLPAFGAEGAAGNMWVVVGRDPARVEADAAPEPERAYPLDLAENLIGRRNGRRDVHPEIPVADPSVSARHLKICRRADGSLYGVDVGSSNGTLLNGAPLSEGVEAPLRAGDSLALGAWTVLRLEAR